MKKPKLEDFMKGESKDSYPVRLNMNTIKQNDPLWTIKETAGFLKVSISTLDNWIKKGTLTVYQIHRKRLIKSTDVHRLLEANKI